MAFLLIWFEEGVAMSRTELGKAFEYACLRALHDTYAVNQDVIIVENEPLMTAMAKFELAGQKQNDLWNTGKAGSLPDGAI